MSSPPPLRIAYVPEHFSTPLAFAQKHFGLVATLLPYPSGTGAMISALRSGTVDIAIGLTEGFIAGLGKPPSGPAPDPDYRLVGTYVNTPLCWAILAGTSASAQATILPSSSSSSSSLSILQGKKIGVSRLGSGSHVMGYVLADRQGWLSASSPEPWSGTEILDNFAGLIAGVNSGRADFFMWETFTSARAIARGEIRKVGEIYTPWASWLITCSTALIGADGTVDVRVADLCERLDQGMRYFEQHQDEAVGHICSVMDYSEDDARKWLGTVEFAHGTKGVDLALVEDCMRVLSKAGVLVEGKGMGAGEMVAIKR